MSVLDNVYYRMLGDVDPTFIVQFLWTAVVGTISHESPNAFNGQKALNFIALPWKFVFMYHIILNTGAERTSSEKNETARSSTCSAAKGMNNNHTSKM